MKKNPGGNGALAWVLTSEPTGRPIPWRAGILPGWVARGPAFPRKTACRPGRERFSVQGRQRAHPRIDPSLCPDKLSCPIVAHRLLGHGFATLTSLRGLGGEARCSKPCLAPFAPCTDKPTSPVAAQTTPARGAGQRPRRTALLFPRHELERARSRWRSRRGRREQARPERGPTGRKGRLP
jgi:hypothetical protein